MIDQPIFEHGAAAAPHSLAAEAGRDVLLEGGNAIEAMVAMAAVISVVYPHMTGMGGDGFWLISDPRRAGATSRVRYIEACGYAGELATRSRYEEKGYDRLPARGPDAVLTVPGAVDGWRVALELAAASGGRLSLARLLEPGRLLAARGYPVSPSEARYQPLEGPRLREAPGYLETFTAAGKTPDAGEMRTMPALAGTLEQLSRAGLRDFYTGDIAREIAVDLDRIGAPVTRADLRRYEARWRAPLSVRLPGCTVYNSPPPTQGLASLIMLGVFSRLGVTRPDGFDYLHGLIEAAKRALAVRDHVCADFDQLREDPAAFVSDAFLDRCAASIDRRRATPVEMPPADGGTVWMGAIDPSGLAVSYIQSIYWDYGSGCVLPRTGLLMQNRGLVFSLDPAALNPLEAGRRPPHTLNPPLALFDDGRVAVYGAMGGDGQPQFQAQVFTRYGFGQSPAAAIDAPRFLFGRTWGDATRALRVEGRVDADVLAALERAGHELLVDDAYSDRLGHAGMIVRHPKGRIEGAHDPRSDGGASGF